MMWRSVSGAALCLLLMLNSQPAPAAGFGEPMNFELTDMVRTHRLSEMPAPVTIINFWRSDCMPCREELPQLHDIASKAQVIAIALQRPQETAMLPEETLQALYPPVKLIHGPVEPRSLLSQFGDYNAALPHTVVLDSERRLCVKSTGKVDRQWLESAVHLCTKGARHARQHRNKATRH